MLNYYSPVVDIASYYCVWVRETLHGRLTGRFQIKRIFTPEQESEIASTFLELSNDFAQLKFS